MSLFGHKCISGRGGVEQLCENTRVSAAVYVVCNRIGRVISTQYLHVAPCASYYPQRVFRNRGKIRSRALLSSVQED